jgi:hypothetical protein
MTTTPATGKCLACGQTVALTQKARQPHQPREVAPHSPPGLQSATCHGSDMPPLSGDVDMDTVRRDAMEHHSAAVAQGERLQEDAQGLAYAAALDYRAADIAEAEYLAELWRGVITTGSYWSGIQRAFLLLTARRSGESSPVARLLGDAQQAAARTFLRSVRHRFIGELADTGRRSDVMLAHIWFNL